MRYGPTIATTNFGVKDQEIVMIYHGVPSRKSRICDSHVDIGALTFVVRLPP